MLKLKKKLLRPEKRLIKKLNSGIFYKVFLEIIDYIFSFKKIFFSLSKNKFGKSIAILSVSFFQLLGNKIAYIDHVIVSKKQRGKGFGKKLFNKTLEKLEEEKLDYAILFSRSDRKVSHNMYRKFGFIFIALGFGFFAYKKLKSKSYKYNNKKFI